MADVLLLGMGLTARSALESLVERVRVVGVVRPPGPPGPPDDPDDPIVTLARRHEVPVFNDPRPSAVADLVARLRPDCVVVSSYDRIIKPDLLQLAKFVNVHYAPLPAYRGRANVNWALINNEPSAAISIHVVAAGVDAGPVLFQQSIPIRPDSTVRSLYDTLNELQRLHLATTVLDHLAGRGRGREQNEGEATHGCARVAADGEIDWSASSRAICRLVRALVEPFPGAFTFLDGRKLLIWEAEALNDPPRYVGRVPGRVIAVAAARGTVDVLCGEGVVRLHEVQLAGEEKTTAAQRISSVRQTLGLRNAELLERIEVLERWVLRLLAEGSNTPEVGTPR